MSGATSVKYTITADDKSSKAIDKITARIDAMTKRVNAMTAPFDKVQKSFSRFADATGLTQISAGMKTISDKALAAAEGIGRIIEPLGVITGAASIAGIVRLTTAWADWGSNLKFTAQNIGISATALQTYEGAAQLAGSSASAMATGLGTLKKNMWDAIGGRNPAFFNAMNIMGIHWRKGKTGVQDLSDVLPQLANRIQATHDPQARMAMLTAALGDSAGSLMPLFMQGASGMATLENQTARHGVTTQAGADAANSMRASMVGLTQSVFGLGIAIAQDLQPVLGPMIDRMSALLDADRPGFAQNFVAGLQSFTVWAQQAWASTDALVQKLGGWKDVMTGISVFVAGSWLAAMLAPFATLTASVAGVTASIVGLPVIAAVAAAAAALAILDALAPKLPAPNASGSWQMDGTRPVFRPTSNQISEGVGGEWVKQGYHHVWQPKFTASDQAKVRDQQMADFMSFGWSKAHAAAIVGNSQGESSFDPGARNGDMAGLFQWSPARAAAIKAATGIDIYTAGVHDQDRATQWELTHTESKAAANLHASPDSFTGGYDFGRDFERFGGSDSDLEARGSNAAYINTLPDPPGAGGSDSTVKIQIVHDNAPAGVNVKATSSSPGVVIDELRINRAMPSASF